MGHELAKTILISKVIELISDKYKISLDEARDKLYSSLLIDSIHDDETGLYGDSPLYVFSVFEEEQIINKLKIEDLQPSQFYISQEKINNIKNWFNPDDLSNFEPIPIKRMGDDYVITDGHTRLVVALMSGLKKVPLVWEVDELNFDLYQICVDECKKQGITSPKDLLNRIINKDEYHEKWDLWCDSIRSN